MFYFLQETPPPTKSSVGVSTAPSPPWSRRTTTSAAWRSRPSTEEEWSASVTLNCAIVRPIGSRRNSKSSSCQALSFSLCGDYKLCFFDRTNVTYTPRWRCLEIFLIYLNKNWRGNKTRLRVFCKNNLTEKIYIMFI
jgi:hypothetical protein